MPQIAAKEVRKQVMACTCPDAHKGQLEAALVSLPHLDLNRLAQIIQTVSQYATKYGPQIWADVQVLISLFGGATPAPGPAPAPGPIPAQRGSVPSCNPNPRELLRVHRSGFAFASLLTVLCLVAVGLLLLCGSARAADRLPVNQLGLPQNMLADCPCGPSCPCGPNCQCGKDCQCGKEAAEFAVLYDDDSQAADDPLQQTPARLPVNQTYAAPAVAAPTFHYENRTRCTKFGCVPYTVIVMDSPPQAGAAGMVVQQQEAVTTYQTVQVPRTSYQTVQVPVTTYESVQVPTTSYQQQTFAAGGDCASCSAGAGAGSMTFASDSGRKGLIQRIRERRAEAHSARVSRRGGGGSCCGG